MGLKETALKGFAWTLGQQVSVQFINFFVQLVLARLLLPEHFGTIAVIQIFLSISQSLIDSGMTTSLIRNKNVDEKDYSTVFYMNLVLSMIVYCVLFILSPAISNLFGNPQIIDVLRVLSLVLIFQSLTSVQVTRLTKEMNFKLQMFLQIPSVLLSGVAGVLLAFYGFGIWSLVYMQIIRFLVLTLTYVFRVRWFPEHGFSLSRFKYHFSFGYKLTLSNLFTTTYNNIYTFLIGSMFSTHQLGLYTQANNLAMFPVSNLTNALRKVTFPVFAKIDDDENLIHAFKKITQSVLIVLAPCMLLLVVIADPLFKIVLTEKWNESIPIFQFLCCFVLFFPINVYNINVLLIKGRSDLHLKLELLKKGITSFFFLLIIPFGIWGIIYAQGIGMLLGVVLNCYFCSKVLNYTLLSQLRDMFKILLVGYIPMFIVLYFDSQIHPFSPNLYVELFSNSILYATLFFILVRIFKIDSLANLKYVILEFIKSRNNKR